jgi:citrate synthase
MDYLKTKFQEKSAEVFQDLRKISKEYGTSVVDKITLNQVMGGMRGLKSMLWITSDLDAYEGIRFRGYSIPQLQEALPKKDGQILPEGLFWLMLVDEIPTDEDVHWLTRQWALRSDVPYHVFKTIDNLPQNMHPMTKFSIGITALESCSKFRSQYDEGLDKSEYWNATYEDTMNLIAKLPRLAAYIYRHSFHGGDYIQPDNTLDWAGNFAHMLGKDSTDFKNLMRLYMVIHADHEGGNASAHTTHLVGSTLSDVYISFASGMNALAGPLHGLANQEVVKWIVKMIDIIGTSKPSNKQVEEYIHSTISAGQVIPGYGHAVLRRPDPRYMAFREFAEEHIKDDDMVNIVGQLYELVPPILKGLGKVKNPWPNIDGSSGAVLMHYGVTEYSYFTVLFGVSRALGVLASLCWARALGMPLERPKSVNLSWVKSFISENETIS